MPTRAFDEVNNYLGTGDPKKGVWFIGLEEGEAWEDATEKEIIEFYGGRKFAYATEEDREKFSISGEKIREFTCKVVCPFSKSFEHQSWQDYRDQVLWERGYLVFQANLYPIGKRLRKVWLPHFKNLFGFGVEDIDKYEEHVRNTRFEKIKELRRECSPQAIICFGDSGWDDFKRLLDLKQSIEKELFNNKIVCYEKERIILTPHFTFGHMSNEKTEMIITKLQEWDVQLP